jgi:2',3'-cyclic-nucleotide 2'-phosphodiesterase (5'-nucleotidase family)
LKFSPAVETIKAQAEMLRREGADFVVAVIHADRRQGYDLHATRAADLILSGHNHDLFVNFDGRNAMAESGHDAHDVTVIDATITVSESNGAREMKWWPQFRIVDTAAVTPDPDVTGEIAKYEQELSREMDIPLATTAVELDGRDATIRTREAALGNLVADAMKASAQADAAITNGGGIRGANVYSPGATMTRRDILSALPFSNRIVTIEIAGKEIRRAIENGLAALPESRGRFPQVSGLVIEADRTKPAGSRVLSIKIGNAALDDHKIYKIATNDFLARGGDGYDMFRDAKQLLPASDSPLMAAEVMAYLRRIGTVRTGVEGRIVLR